MSWKKRNDVILQFRLADQNNPTSMTKLKLYMFIIEYRLNLEYVVSYFHKYSNSK